MKRFHFNLRPVSVIRTHREMRARDAFASAVHLYVEAEEKLARVRERKAEFEAALFAGRRGRFHAAGEAQSLAAYRRECLEERARAGHRQAAGREEQAEYDDFAGRAAHRKLSPA